MSWLRALCLTAPLVVQLSDCGSGCGNNGNGSSSTPTDTSPTSPTDPDSGDDDSRAECTDTYGGYEVCDGVDNDCNGAIDDACGPYDGTFMRYVVQDMEELVQEENALDLLDFDGDGEFDLDDDLDEELDDMFRHDNGLVFTNDGAMAFFNTRGAAMFLTRDGTLRGGNARPFDAVSGNYGPVDEFKAFVQNSDTLLGFIWGEWEEEVPGSAQDRIRRGTMLFEIDPITGARGDLVAGVKDVYWEYAAFLPDGRLVAYTREPFGPNVAGPLSGETINPPPGPPGPPGAPLVGPPTLYIDALSDLPLELTPPHRLFRFTVDPTDPNGLYACVSSDEVAVRIGDDGRTENAFGLHSFCPSLWAFGPDGRLYMREGGTDFIIVRDLDKQNKEFPLADLIFADMDRMDVSPNHDEIWIWTQEDRLNGGEIDQIAYIPLGPG